MLIVLGLSDANSGIEVVIGQGWVQHFVADDTRHILSELYRLDVLGARTFQGSS